LPGVGRNIEAQGRFPRPDVGQGCPTYACLADTETSLLGGRGTSLAKRRLIKLSSAGGAGAPPSQGPSFPVGVS
jgi:hypothetical protein